MGQWPRALAYADKGLGHHPGHVPLLVLKAKCLNETGHPQKALTLLDLLLEKDPLHPVNWLEKLKALILLRRKEEAAALVRKLPPQYPPALTKEFLKIIQNPS